MKRIPKTPVEFDYDLWTTEDGKCMVRVKLTGEVTEVDREVMKILRAEEKKLRRSFTGDASEDGEDGVDTILSLDYVSYEGGEDMEPVWLEDKSRMEDEVMMDMMIKEFAQSLTPKQFDVFQRCLLGGVSLREYNKWITLMKSVSTAEQLSQDLVDESVELVKVHDDGSVELVMKYGDIYALTLQSIKEVQEAM